MKKQCSVRKRIWCKVKDIKGTSKSASGFGNRKDIEKTLGWGNP